MNDQFKADHTESGWRVIFAETMEAAGRRGYQTEDSVAQAVKYLNDTLRGIDCARTHRQNPVVLRAIAKIEDVVWETEQRSVGQQDGINRLGTHSGEK